MRTLEIENQKLSIKDDVEEILEGQVKKIGSGAMVLVPKKYLGKMVYIVMKKD